MNKLILALMLVTTGALAAPPMPPMPPPPPAALPDVPPPPPGIESGQVMEPGVRIIQTDNEMIYEYRAGSHLYMVRVVPKFGPPYYFFDQDGDGQLDYQEKDPRSSKVNQWILYRW